MRTFVLFDAKHIEISGMPTRTGGEGVSQCEQGVVIFDDFVRTSFMDSPLL